MRNLLILVYCNVYDNKIVYYAKNNFSDVSDFSKKYEIILCAFANVYSSHLWISETDF